jgi:hypothetical protein
MNLSLNNLSPQQLRQAANVKEKIDSLQRELARLIGATLPSSNHVAASGRTMSAAARARIAAAARKRWAKIKGGKSAGATPKRKMSAAARARLAAIARARWKKAKAAGKSAL